jgi:hypothetical protein
MAYFQNKNPNSGKFWRVLHWMMMVYFMAIWYIGGILGIFCGNLAYFPRFGILYHEQSGNPAREREKKSIESDKLRREISRNIL